MNILFIMNGIGSVDGLAGISGGDVRWIEIAKCWQRDGHKIHVLTPQIGVSLCNKLGLQAVFHIFGVPDEYSLKTYLLRFLKSRSLPKSLDGFEGIVYSTTEHVYDVLPASKIEERGKASVWVAAVHWVAPVKRKGTSWLNGLLFFFNQRMGFRYIKNKADIILAISENTTKQVKQIGIRKNVFTVGAGVDYQRIRQIASKIKTKRYDAVFMKRLDGTKGVFDMIEIWKNVVKCKENAKLVIMGLGTKDVMTKLQKLVEKYGLEDNVCFLGPIYDFDRKFSTLASSRLLTLPSYEENWAIVIGEAMAAGVPVLCYDLPEIKPIWHDNVLWIPKGDRLGFAGMVLRLLDGEDERANFARKEVEFIKEHSWNEIANVEMNLILSARAKHGFPN